MKKNRRILGRGLARNLNDDELLEVYGGRLVAVEPDYTSTKDPVTGEEID